MRRHHGIARADALDAAEMVARGVTTIDVLPTAIFGQEHLPGARNVPLQTFTTDQVDGLDRDATLLVYCFDQH